MEQPYLSGFEKLVPEKPNEIIEVLESRGYELRTKKDDLYVKFPYGFEFSVNDISRNREKLESEGVLESEIVSAIDFLEAKGVLKKGRLTVDYRKRFL